MDKKSAGIIIIIKEIKSFFNTQSKRIIGITIVKDIGIICSLAYLFYDSFFYVILLLPVFFFLFLEDIRRIKKKETEQLLMQFQDMLSVVSQDLQAGSSVENAFIHAEKELKAIYDVNAALLVELRKVIHGLSINIPIEKLINTMSETISEEEIQTFASVFISVKRTGANMVETISFTVNSLIEKIRIKRETNMIISSKKLEQSIMSVIPMAIICYIKLTSGEFIESLYHNLSGVIIMTIFLILYAVAYIWSKSIMNIEV